MRSHKKLVIFLLILTIVLLVRAEKRLRAKIKDLTVWSDNKYVNLTYHIDTAVPSIELDMKVMKTIKDVEFEFMSNTKTKINEYHHLKTNVSYNLCNIIGFTRSHPLGLFLLAHLKSFGHLPDNCPIKKDTYSFKKSWNEAQMPKLKLPELDFNGDLKIHAINGNNEKLPVVTASFMGELIYMDDETARRNGLVATMRG